MSSERLSQLLQFLRENPAESFLLFAVAKEYEKAGEPEQALDYYKRLTEQDPAYVGAYYHLGKLHEQRGEFAAARETYRRGMEVAQQAGDRHAYGELAGASLNLEN